MLYLDDGLIEVLLLDLWFPVQGEIRTVCKNEDTQNHESSLMLPSWSFIIQLFHPFIYRVI